MNSVPQTKCSLHEVARFVVGTLAVLAFAGCDLGTYAQRVEKASTNYRATGLSESDRQKLGQGDQFVAYSFDVPDGFVSTPVPAPPNANIKAAGWGGPINADGLRASIIVTQTIPPKNAKIPTLSAAATQALAGLKNRRKRWKNSTPTKVSISSFDFMRTDWTGTAVPQNIRLKGTSYVGLIGRQVMMLSIQSPANGDTGDLDRAKAAVQTFRIKNQ